MFHLIFWDVSSVQIIINEIRINPCEIRLNQTLKTWTNSRNSSMGGGTFAGHL